MSRNENKVVWKDLKVWNGPKVFESIQSHLRVTQKVQDNGQWRGTCEIRENMQLDILVSYHHLNRNRPKSTIFSIEIDYY